MASFHAIAHCMVTAGQQGHEQRDLSPDLQAQVVHSNLMAELTLFRISGLEAIRARTSRLHEVWEKAILNTHPDKGGSKEDFVAFHEAYIYLATTIQGGGAARGAEREAARGSRHARSCHTDVSLDDTQKFNRKRRNSLQRVERVRTAAKTQLGQRVATRSSTLPTGSPPFH